MDDKKRIMFILGEDYYFITYSILIMLKYFKAIDSKHTFKDIRKINLVLDLISNNEALYILERAIKFKFNCKDLPILENCYSNYLKRTPIFNRIIYILNHHKYITIHKNGLIDDVNINVDVIDKEFFDNELFKDEIDNIKILKSLFKQINRMKYNSLLDRIFTNNGVLTWGI